MMKFISIVTFLSALFVMLPCYDQAIINEDDHPASKKN